MNHEPPKTALSLESDFLVLKDAQRNFLGVAKRQSDGDVKVFMEAIRGPSR